MKDLATLAEEQLTAARADRHGRSALLILRDVPLRQTVIALTDGTQLGEHATPPAASLQVLRGSVRVSSDHADVELPQGVLYLLPSGHHSVTAIGDAAVLLTAVNP
ncbi:cupin [Streptomyces sp. NPDC090022]|uniref:cupin n=1 Tax=Streptomyces sp. NPDC090022 TaxID=3365920 RepID=UPI00382CA3A2